MELIQLSLFLAATKGYSNVVKALLWMSTARVIAAAEENYALRIAARNGHVKVVLALLAICEVKATAAIKENLVLHLAAEYGHFRIVQALLAIDEVKATVTTRENLALRMAAENGHTKVVRELLMIEAVRVKATACENHALCKAAENGHTKVVRELLAVYPVRAKATACENYALRKAAENGHTEIVKMLIAIPQVLNYLLRNEGEELIKLLKVLDKTARLVVFEQLNIYGISLAQIMDKKSKTLIEDIQFYCIDPQGYLERAADYSLNQIQAVRLLKSHLDVTNHELMQEEAQRAMEQEQNPDDEGKIAVVINHFEKVIKPAFKEKLTGAGATDTERLMYVESEIRALLLNRIVKDLQAQLQNENNTDEIKKLKLRIKLIHANFDDLKLGQDENLMAQARNYFCSNHDNNHIAWRAYDKWAPCVKEWPNLLTPPVEKGHQKAFTVDVLGGHDITSASLKVRELVAYSFLLVMDKNDGDDATRLDRVENFIGQIKDIRRAHNADDDEGMDNPSCFPGSVGRIGTMWSMHSLALTKKMLELLPEIFKSIIARKFSAALARCDTQGQKDALYHALIMLRKENAQDVINKQAEFYENPAWARKRQEFIDNIGSLKEIEQEVNLVLKEMQSEDRLTPGQYVYLFEYLADIGGGWSAEILTRIYRQHASEMEIGTIPIAAKINNPFAINPIITKMLSVVQLNRREQSFIAWKIILPILEKNFSDQEELEMLAKMIATDWANSKNNDLTALEFSTLTQDELDRVMTDPQQQNAINDILHEYKSTLNANQINEVDKAQSNEQKIEDDSVLYAKNALIFSKLSKVRHSQDSKDELISALKQIKNDDNYVQNCRTF